MNISVVLDFNRMKTLTKDPEVVAAAVTDSEVVKVSDDKKRIKRRNPLPEEDTLIKRSIYAVRFYFGSASDARCLISHYRRASRLRESP